MRLTLKTDYALRTLLFLGRQKGQLVAIATVAQAHHISENHLVKVVHELGRKGFIETIRGKGGGIRLAQGIESKSVGDVVRAMEDDLALVACFGQQDAANTCALTDDCRLQSILYEALKGFLQTLDRYTLGDVMAAAEEKNHAAQLKKSQEQVIPLTEMIEKLRAFS